MSMWIQRSGRTLVLAASVCALALAAMATCEKSQPAPSSQTRPADKVYMVRGKVTMLPEPGKPTSQLVIHHEAIDTFEKPDGTTGMASMEMPLPPASGVDLSEIKVGDPIEFDLSVWYKPTSGDAKKHTVETFRVTRVKKLPPDTVLNFGDAAPTLGAPTSGGH